MSFKSIYISLISVAIILSGLSMRQDVNNNSYTLVSTSKVFTAGASISLEFSFEGSTEVILYCSNSYGSILLHPILDKTLSFKIPQSISNKSGILNWQLLSESTLLSGEIEILPKVTIETIETYIGPPSIEAGGTDYTMLVSIPTDDLDNPLVDSTKVSVKHQFLDIETKDEIFTKHGFGYKNLYSYEKSGRVLINTECLDLNSKEYDVNVVPAIPTSFSISADRIHSYADGNQITNFKTSIIKDRFNNIVSDGTYVTFFITNKLGYKAYTSGTTLDGRATAKMLHPDQEDQWTIKAYIEGMANSEFLVLNYKQAISDFDVSFSKNNRAITVGPLQSFMDQYIPNGLSVVLKVYKDGILDDEFTEQSVEGYANFKLKKDRYPKGNYKLVVKVAGLTKSFPNLKYE
ncbi:hypothetical protein RM697_10025 [Ichthyenterobacterium sp. W332]|uniref:Uncharacterized protein n=1 Tax=Microcosmobacter mediterraneus TaxID=3075607 RepID=A0ABU2YM78_9FLAO|nr:hypothetical protein [Ichthyenterobacterium sp. W332]MDT0558986.1 hypothetical protein [Ichthyenterobacterium sp. W332]